MYVTAPTFVHSELVHSFTIVAIVALILCHILARREVCFMVAVATESRGRGGSSSVSVRISKVLERKH